MNEKDNVEFLKQCYAAYGAGNLDYLVSCMTDDIVWELPDVPNLPFTGKRQGAQNVADYFKLSNEYLAIREFVPHEFIAQGDKVVVLGHGEWTAKETGMDFDSDWVHVF